MTKDVIVYSAHFMPFLRYVSSSQQAQACDTVQHCAVKACQRDARMVKV